MPAGFSSLWQSLREELGRYYSISHEAVGARCQQAALEVETDWRAVNVSSEAEIRECYRDNEWCAFDVADWHTALYGRRFLDIVLCSAAAKTLGLSDYLDYGSGIGSHGIHMAAQGFSVTLADVSPGLFDSCRWRFETRRLSATLMDLSLIHI